MADPRCKQIKIKTGVVKRLAKEVGYYEKEAVREQARQDTMKNEGKDEYDIKKQAEVIAESMIMIPDTKRRLKKAHEDLQKVLETDKDLNETEEYKDAQVQLEEARKVIDAEQQS